MNDLNTFLRAKSGGVANLQSERGQAGSIVWFAEGMLKRAPIFFPRDLGRLRTDDREVGGGVHSPTPRNQAHAHPTHATSLPPQMPRDQKEIERKQSEPGA